MPHNIMLSKLMLGLTVRVAACAGAVSEGHPNNARPMGEQEAL